MKATKKERKELLKALKKDLKNKTIYVSTLSSGKSKKIKMYYVKNGCLYNISNSVAIILGYKYGVNDGALRVRQVGDMDAVSTCLSNLNDLATYWNVIKPSKVLVNINYKIL